MAFSTLQNEFINRLLFRMIKRSAYSWDEWALEAEKDESSLLIFIPGLSQTDASPWVELMTMSGDTDSDGARESNLGSGHTRQIAYRTSGVYFYWDTYIKATLKGGDRSVLKYHPQRKIFKIPPPQKFWPKDATFSPKSNKTSIIYG